MLSIDYPYESIDQGPKWFDSITDQELKEEEKEQIAFGNAKKILKLK